MHLIGLVKSAEHVCCRYRLAAFRQRLARAGHHLELRAWPTSWLAALWFPSTLAHADAVIMLRRLPAAWQLARLRRAVPKLLFDLDDAVFLRDSYATRGPSSDRRRQGFERMVRAADAVIAGNDFLAEHAAACAGGDKVHVLPTCVATERYSLALHERAGPGVQLVWIGSSSTLQGLEQSRPLWDHIGWQHPGLTLKLLCDRPLSLRFLPVHFRGWSEATEAAELAAADIGVSWLPDDDWSRGKCGLKVLQYMAAGLPVVANPVGVQARMVRHGETGFLATTAGEWSEAIGRLAGDPGLRRRMGAAARQVVEEQYSVTAGAERWLGVLDRLAGVPAVATEVAA